MATPSRASSNLPRVFVPALAPNLHRYLECLVAVVPPAQLQATKRLVQEFAKPGGQGEKIQEKLKQFAATRENWVTDLWLDDMYLCNPLPLPVNSNPFFLLPKQNFKSSTDQCRFAARTVVYALKFKAQIDSGTLKQDWATSRGQKTPLCMQTYKQFFPSYRKPGLKKDELVIATEPHNHIVVAYRNQFFVLKLPTQEDDLSEDVLTDLLLSIKDQNRDTEDKAPTVGILTTENRRTWAELYAKLSRNNVNQYSLQALETCLLVLCLDQPLTLKHNYSTIRRESFTLDLGAMAVHLLHGGGTDFNSANRWYDKFLQVVVSRDGVCGIVVEHAASEGITVLRFCNELFEYIENLSTSPKPSQDSSKYSLSKLNWELGEDIMAAIQEASKKMNKLADDVDLYVLRFTEFGKDFIKEQNISPDVFVQLSLQLTYYKVHRKLVSTYESASLRKFHLGRVDTIRAATSEALSWVRALCDDTDVTEEEKVRLFQEAIKKQTEVLKYTINGEGPDNHLLGLREMAKMHGMDDSLFRDKSYREFLNFRLSTSQLPNDLGILVGYGPVVPDGYGCAYTICPNHIDFCVSSFFSSPETSSDFYALSLEGSLLQMRELCLKRRSISASETKS